MHHREPHATADWEAYYLLAGAGIALVVGLWDDRFGMQPSDGRVADAGENIVFRGKAIRKEKIETEVGDFDAIVIKPEITVKGIFKPIGDIYFWLSDDDRKFILRIESSIKIGTIVSEVVKLKPGN